MAMTYKQHKIVSRHRRLEHRITEEEYEKLRTGTCTYCKGPGGGIDRVDSSKGYIDGNCVSCCKRCNARKAYYEQWGVKYAVKMAKKMAYKNQIPPPSKREWKRSWYIWEE